MENIVHPIPVDLLTCHRKRALSFFSIELAEMTKFLPGPTSIDALLSRTGLLSGKKIEVVQVVNAVREDWLQDRVSTKLSSALTTPIHEAVRRRLETGKGKAWVAGWAAITQLPETLQLTPLQIGIQFYREALYMMELLKDVRGTRRTEENLYEP